MMTFRCTIFLILLVITYNCFGQAPKGANRIIANGGMSFVDVVGKLTDAGYEIEKTDKELGLITTNPREVKGFNAVHYLYLVVKKDVVIVSGQLKVNTGLNPEYWVIENKGMKGSVIKESFTIMENFAGMLSTNLEYESK